MTEKIIATIKPRPSKTHFELVHRAHVENDPGMLVFKMVTIDSDNGFESTSDLILSTQDVENMIKGLYALRASIR